MPKLRWVLVYAITSFIIAVTLVTFFREIGRIGRLAGALETRTAELGEMTRRSGVLRDKISYYSSPAGVAYLARAEYNLVRSGEKIYKIEIVSRDKK